MSDGGAAAAAIERGAVLLHGNIRKGALCSPTPLNVGPDTPVVKYDTGSEAFGGIGASCLGSKEGVREAMKSCTNVKTYSLPW